ncbi:RNAse (barnase) inhibitor barstar [Paraburkholderia silvatlantica]|uniref:RNAse (Barnase) inhibitor barstar n=2 Tax=Paraburkholderia silvatlantica TaxID=321895 RepID=A0A2U1AB07_9BURK|nr:RNAse (barnase) inhibitor barstar [Paraburkholderia silvatlantica]PVY31965.1 RNAse (barnase) inhibitor barstar [Paraburkholderia silvatlantica]PXW37536.1 RNAse (barnase) inhibitor barstar [Paraburkholderia silvatlantica]PYE13620.1 RNAse (barnase) inhibitor barstar [Paraburkholderia silvatlantica]TDQ76141.1 RNAse (barnase) inhibitor barstar [Paraburkholderia silvatlantica]
MSDNVYAHDPRVASDLFASGEGNLFQRVMQLKHDSEARQDEAGLSSNEGAMSLFSTVQPNIVQSIRAFRIQDLADEAQRLQQHFLYAFCANAQTKQEVLETIATSFLFPKHFGKNYDGLYDCLTDLVQKAGEQPGFVIVLEGLPIAQKFDKDGRETLLDVFREASEYWAERKVPFRVFYSFA